MPFAAGNTARLLVDGKAVFDAIFEGIDGAEDYVLAQFFIVHDDQIGREFQAKLIAKVKNGGSGAWGQIPMPPNASVPDADLKTIVKWVLSQKK